MFSNNFQTKIMQNRTSPRSFHKRLPISPHLCSSLSLIRLVVLYKLNLVHSILRSLFNFKMMIKLWYFSAFYFSLNIFFIGYFFTSYFCLFPVRSYHMFISFSFQLTYVSISIWTILNPLIGYAPSFLILKNRNYFKIVS